MIILPRWTSTPVRHKGSNSGHAAQAVTIELWHQNRNGVRIWTGQCQAPASGKLLYWSRRDAAIATDRHFLLRRELRLTLAATVGRQASVVARSGERDVTDLLIRARRHGRATCRCAARSLDRLRELLDRVPPGAARGASSDDDAFRANVAVGGIGSETLAEIDAIDVDHGSQPRRQYMIRDRREVARTLFRADAGRTC